MSAPSVPSVVVVANDAQVWPVAATVYGAYPPPASLTSEPERRILVGEARAEVPQARGSELATTRDTIFQLISSAIDDTISQELAKHGKKLDADVLIVLGKPNVFIVDVARSTVSLKVPPSGDVLASLKAALAAGAPPGGGGPQPGPIIEPVPRPPPGLMLEKVEDLAAKDPLPQKAPETFPLRPIDVQREYVRGAIALALVGALILTIILVLLGDMFDHPVDGTKLNAAITALVGLVGSATGFYFGSQTSSQGR